MMLRTENPAHILIITDDWFPHISGVANTLGNVKLKLEEAGHRVSIIFPDPEKFILKQWLLGHPEIDLAVWPKQRDLAVDRQIEQLNPDQIYIATPEGPLGATGVFYCAMHNLNFSSGFHTKFAEFAAEWAKSKNVPEFMLPAITEAGYAALKLDHGKAYRTLVPEGMIPELQQRGFENLVIFNRGVDTDLFYSGESNVYDGLPRPIFLNVGRVSYEKGLDVFLAANLPGTKVIVGPFLEDEEKSKSYLEKLKAIDPNTIFVGPKRGKKLAEYYRGADVFAFPSITDTFGNVQLEALASGLVLATRVNPASGKIIASPNIGIMDDNYERACLKAYELSLKKGNKEACIAHILKYYNGWEGTAQTLANNLIDVKESRTPNSPTYTGKIYDPPNQLYP